MKRLLLPIGIQSFRKLREDDCYYVDKTALIQKLVNQGSFYFLSRPRRFGKSLLLDTLHELFEGSEPLFQNLAIHDHWDWDSSHPVVHLSFGGKFNEPGDLETDIKEQLATIERTLGLEPKSVDNSASGRLRDLLVALHHCTGKTVVVLVDEYDKPILDVLDDPELAQANRDLLRGFYGVIKDSAREIRFVFVTGITMFSKVSLFSGLNNLDDISMDPQFATLCGYTDEELDKVFNPELEGLDREEIREWYNGYNFRGNEKVYNPFDVLLLFRKRSFRPWWFETGSPSFLFQTMMTKGVSPLDLENLLAAENLVSTFDIDDISAEALLFQTGYLTLTGEELVNGRSHFRLGYPNREVRHSLNDGLLQHITNRSSEAAEQGSELSRLLVANDFSDLEAHLRAFFAGIPYQWQGNPEFARYEAWYAGILYSCFETIGVDVRVEESSSQGRSDMVIHHGSQVFVLEFKMAKEDEETDTALTRALTQIRDRGYGEKYRDRGEPIHLLGLVFSRRERNLIGIRAESY